MRSKFTFLLLSLCTLFTTAFSQNTAISLNGTSSVVTTSAFVVPTSGDFTVEFWTLVPVLNSGLHEFISQGGSGGGFYIGYDQGTGNLRAGDNWQNTGVPFPVNQWVHIALVKSGTNASLYLNAHLLGSTTGYSINSGGDFFKIGNQFSGFSEFMNGNMDEIRVWNVARTAAQIQQTLLGADPASTGLVAYYTANEGSGATLGNSTSTTGLDGTLTSTTWTSSPVQYSTNALTFDGSNDQVIVPPSTNYDLTTGTIEASVYPTLLDASNRCIVANRNVTGARFSFHASSTQLGLWNGTSFATFNYALPLNTWTHLAFVCDGAQTTIYANGTSIGAFTEAFGTVTGQTLNIGISKSAGADGEAWQGAIDEVRIWNTQLSAASINANMGLALSGSESGLVGLFNFDAGNPGNDNTGFITAFDNTAATNNGTLFNFALTGTLSNLTLNTTLGTLPVIFNSFNAVAKNGQALLQWQTAQEQNSASFIIERSTDGVAYSEIGVVAAAGNSSSASNYSFVDANPKEGLNYYRLNETDLDGKSMYSVVKTLSFTTATGQKLSWYSTGIGAAEVRLSAGNNELYLLTDLNGRTLQQGQLSAGRLTIANRPAGLYIVKVITASGQSMEAKVVLP